MRAQQSAGTPPDAHADRAPPQPRGRRRRAVRWTVHGLLLVALTAGIQMRQLGKTFRPLSELKNAA